MGLGEDTISEQRLAFVAEHPNPIISIGWPPAPVQSTPEDLVFDLGFGRKILRIENDTGLANYGDGNCQICLENDLLDWACS